MSISPTKATKAQAAKAKAKVVKPKVVKAKAAKGTIILAHSLSIADATKLQAQLADCSINKIPVRIDAGEVARVDTAILQVLLASVITGRFSGRPLTWTEVSKDFLASAQRLGLSAELGLPKRG